MRAMLRSAVLATAVTASLFSATSAVAGGAPDYGDVNVDRRVVLQDGALTIGGTYQCEGPGERLGRKSHVERTLDSCWHHGRVRCNP